MIPNSGITISSVANELKEYGRNILGDLCNSSKINYLCKYKPVRLSSPLGKADAGSFRFDGMGGIQYVDYKNYWWKSSKGYCGMNMAGVNIVIGSNSDPVWTYESPSKGSYPCRIGDFGGYSQGATFGGIRLDPPTLIYAGNSFSVGINHIYASENGLKYSDIFDTSIVGVNDDTGLYLAASTSSSSYYYAERKIDLSRDHAVSFSLNEIGNPSAGNYVRLHLYGRTMRGEIVSAKYNSSADVFHSIQITSTGPFVLLVACEGAFWRRGDVYYNIRNLTCDLNASMYQGGSIQASHIYMQTQIDGYWYNQWEYRLPAASVSSGSINRLNPWGQSFDVYIGTNEYNQVRFEWNVPGYSPIYQYVPVREY